MNNPLQKCVKKDVKSLKILLKSILMKLKNLRNKKKFKFVSIIWLMGMLSSCSSYYYLNSASHKIKDNLLSEMNADNTLIFIHSDHDLFSINQVEMNNKQLVGSLVSTNKEEIALYQQTLAAKKQHASFHKDKNAFKNQQQQASSIEIDTLSISPINEGQSAKNSPEITHQVHLFTNKFTQNDKEIKLDLSQLTRLEILKKTKSNLSTFAIIMIVIGSILAFFLILIIILAIACNCPHVYLDNGNGYSYTNTLFTGAVSQGLERFDYKLIPDYFPNHTSLNMQIRNEDHETQFTNLVQLVAAYHDPSFDVLSDQKGTLYSVTQAQSALTANDLSGKSLTEMVSEKDGSVYAFDTPSRNGMTSSYITFKKGDSQQNAKLVLSVRNSDWAGLIHQEFNAALGEKHQSFTTKNRQKSGLKQNKALQKAGIPLLVYVKKGNKWMEVEAIQPVGNANMQTLVIPLDKKMLTGNQVEIRMDAGFKFWEIDYAAMDFSAPQSFEVTYLSPTSVSGDPDFKNALSKNDEHYMRTSSGSEAVSVQFNGLKPTNRTLFIQSKGYYIREEQQAGKPDWVQLAKLKRNHGLARFSQDVFLRYLNDFEQISKN